MDIKAELACYGVAEGSVLWLDELRHDNLEYLDLVGGVALDWERQTRIHPAAVIEFERQPLLYVFAADSLTLDPAQYSTIIQALLTKLACRGDSAWLAVLTPGQLTLHAISISDAPSTSTHIPASSPRARTFIQDLAMRWREDAVTAAAENAFHDLLFELVTMASSNLLKTKALKGKTEEVLSLVGRALFSRFLIDRGLMNQETYQAFRGPFETCFNTSENAINTCRWLDKTFNGELLPLAGEDYSGFFKGLGKDAPAVLQELSNILHHAPGGQTSFREAWGNIDFAHVPIGLLSEVYEQFAHEHGPEMLLGGGTKKTKLAKAESIHYTPRIVAEYMLNQALSAVKTRPVHQARVLDPAAGGGVFLTLAYRRLVSETWQAEARPSRKKLRDILYDQICGFDINESALRLAALSLYLTALELDPDPHTPGNMEFKPLIGRVLFNARSVGEEHPNPQVLGSIGPGVGSKHNGRYDMVIGNPPWTSWKTQKKGAPKEEDLNYRAEQIVRQIAAARAVGGTNTANTDRLIEIAKYYENPDRVPDLPFVWRAMEWATTGGIIALALHARLLFKQSERGIAARNALFSTLRVTGVLNGASLRQQNLWPNTDAPWCLLFAKNEVPNDDQVFYFVSPEQEEGLNQSGLMRVDYPSAEPIQFSIAREESTLLKTLFRGTALDAEVVGRIRKVKTVPLRDYWRRHGLFTGEGYQIVSGGIVPTELVGLPNLTTEARQRFAVNTRQLSRLGQIKMLFPRKRRIYRAPLLIMPESISWNRSDGFALLAHSDVVYSESFYGYTTHGYGGKDKARADRLARYVHLLTYSQLFVYWTLMTSSKFGVERDSLLKADVDAFPLVPYEDLKDQHRKKIAELSVAIESGQCPWEEVDTWVSELYGLNAQDRQTIADTLAVATPYSGAQMRAQRTPTNSEVTMFATQMEALLKPLFGHLDAKIEVRSRPTEGRSWRFLDVCCNGSDVPEWTKIWLRSLADAQGASRIFVRNSPGHIGIGLLAEYRYWTPSRARLCALDIIRQHSDYLMGKKNAA